jgi:hypothetical protein
VAVHLSATEPGGEWKNVGVSTQGCMQLAEFQVMQIDEMSQKSRPEIKKRN